MVFSVHIFLKFVEHVANATFQHLQVPAEMGGVDLNFTAACLAIEEVAKVDPAVSALMDRALGWS